MRPRPAVAAALLPVLATLLAGCRDMGPSTDGLLEQVADQRALWASQRPAAYVYQLGRSCRCSEEERGPVWVRVQGAQVVSRVYSANGSPVSSGLQGVFPSVEGLFDLVEEAARKNAWSINVTWHPEQGYPASLFVDYDGRSVQDDVWYTVMTAPAPDTGS